MKMKLKVNNYNGDHVYSGIEAYALDKLNDPDHGMGKFESLLDTTLNNSMAIGRLLEVLAAKLLLDEDDIGNIIEGYSGHIEFVDN